MTRTGPADVAMSACAHATAGRPVPARPGFCELVSVWPASGAPTVVRAVFPGSACLKPASRRPQPASQPPRCCPVSPSGRRVGRGCRAPGRPRSGIRFTCTCSSGLQQHYLEVQLLPEGTCYA
jgi:hypothetical protein